MHHVTELSVGQVAAKIANLKIDVLVDLTGWTLFPCTEILAMHVRNYGKVSMVSFKH